MSREASLVANEQRKIKKIYIRSSILLCFDAASAHKQCIN